MTPSDSTPPETLIISFQFPLSRARTQHWQSIQAFTYVPFTFLFPLPQYTKTTITRGHLQNLHPAVSFSHHMFKLFVYPNNQGLSQADRLDSFQPVVCLDEPLSKI